MKMFKKLKNEFGANEFLFFSGLLLIFVGLIQYKPWVAYVVDGSIMVITGLFGKK